ncbi:MAG: hypothetical protein ABEH61_05125, partial [Haloarculaceae archaeon]
MRLRQVVGTGVVVLVAALAIAAPVLGAGLPTSGGHQTDDSGQAEGFGQQVASFAQTTSVDAQSSVDQGMWEAEASSSENPDAEVSERAETIQQRTDRLRAQIQTLQAQRDQGVISETEYAARASALQAELSNLQESIDETEEIARETGVEAGNIDRLREEARQIPEPEVPEPAEEITDAPRGPPEDD